MLKENNIFSELKLNIYKLLMREWSQLLEMILQPTLRFLKMPLEQFIKQIISMISSHLISSALNSKFKFIQMKTHSCWEIFKVIWLEN